MKIILIDPAKDDIEPEFEIKTPQPPEVARYNGSLYIHAHYFQNKRAAYVKAQFPILEVPKEEKS
jgi:hypothetical protein